MTFKELIKVCNVGGFYQLTQEQYYDLLNDIYALDLIREYQIDCRTMLSPCCLSHTEYNRICKSKHYFKPQDNLIEIHFKKVKEALTK